MFETGVDEMSWDDTVSDKGLIKCRSNPTMCFDNTSDDNFVALHFSFSHAVTVYK